MSFFKKDSNNGSWNIKYSYKGKEDSLQDLPSSYMTVRELYQKVNFSGNQILKNLKVNEEPSKYDLFCFERALLQIEKKEYQYMNNELDEANIFVTLAFFRKMQDLINEVDLESLKEKFPLLFE